MESNTPDHDKPLYPMLAAQMILLLEQAKAHYEENVGAYVKGGGRREKMEDWLKRCDKLFERLEAL